MHDYLVFRGAVAYQPSCSATLSAFPQHLQPLSLTRELLPDKTIKFIDLKQRFYDGCPCWQYEPRACQPLLPFSSGHSKIVKRGVANLCILNSPRKSCPRNTAESLDLTDLSPVPEHLLITVVRVTFWKDVRRASVYGNRKKTRKGRNKPSFLTSMVSYPVIKTDQKADKVAHFQSATRPDKVAHFHYATRTLDANKLHSCRTTNRWSS